MNDEEINLLIEVYENEYYFDTKQERKLALKDFARDITRIRNQQKKEQVEWLKEQFKSNLTVISKREFLNKIDEAFEDVVKEERK